MMMRFTTLLVLVLAAVPGRAQVVGRCESGVAQAILDANDVRATLFNRGNLFFGNEVDDGSGYIVPRSRDCSRRYFTCSPIFGASLWVGGRIEGEVRATGARYSDFEFWPGPLEHDATLPNASDCSAYDRIFVVSRQDVARYLQTGEATDDLRDWPVAWGAPVLDGDGVEGNYNLSGGDQPAILGQQMAWWVMNDVGNEQLQTGGAPLGIEVQVEAFASPDGALAIRQATFYRYRIVNRNRHPIRQAYVTFWVESDLGDPADDYVGSDTTRSLGFTYGSRDPDVVYGTSPALGVRVVQGPVGLPNGRDDDGDGAIDEQGERLGMTAFPCYSKLSIGEPGEDLEYYRCMQGLWTDGVPITMSGWGYKTEGRVTTFGYPGAPETGDFWSEVSEGNSPGDRRFAVATGPFDLGSGEATDVVFAIPFGQGGSHLDSVTQLRIASDIVQNAWDTGFLAPSWVEVNTPPDVPGAVELTAPTPNPFRDRLTVRYTLPDAMPARVTVLDVLGREIAVLVQGGQAIGPRTVEVDTSGWPSGVYLVRVEAGTERRTFPVVRAR